MFVFFEGGWVGNNIMTEPTAKIFAKRSILDISQGPEKDCLGMILY